MGQFTRRCKREMGEITKGTRRQLAGSTDGSGGAILVPPETDAPTLAQLGFTRNYWLRQKGITEPFCVLLDASAANCCQRELSVLVTPRSERSGVAGCDPVL
jgi:hypothetical protein